MKKLIFLVIVIVAGILFTKLYIFKNSNSISGAPPYGESETDIPDIDPLNWLNNWTRPEGPARVGIQVGHWKNEELPEELKRLRGSTGSSGGDKAEWEVNLTIAEETAKILKEKGITVDILPATVPPQYWADVFIAIHADGNTNSSVSGYKIAAPWRDFTRRAETLVSHLDKEYGLLTKLNKDPNISRNMRGYYAFSWWRYTHAVHPMTTSAIIETGFLTSPSDRKLLINNPEIPAQALSTGIINYLTAENLLSS